jgi:hypothetical protein
VLREDEPAVRKLVEKYIPPPEVRKNRELQATDYSRISADVGQTRELIAQLGKISQVAEITAAMDALIAYEVALEEDDMEVLLVMAA